MNAKDIVANEVARQKEFGYEPSWEDFVIAGIKESRRQVIEKIEGFKHQPRLYHHICYASGIVCVVDRYGEGKTYKCPYFNAGFNCGYRGCKDGKIKGYKDLTEVEAHQNWQIESLLKELEEKE